MTDPDETTDPGDDGTGPEGDPSLVGTPSFGGPAGTADDPSQFEGKTRSNESDRTILAAAAVALFAGVGAVAGSYVAVGRSPGFIVAPIAEVVVALTPDAVITFSIIVLGDLGTKLAFVLSVAVTAALVGVVVGLAAAVARSVGADGTLWPAVTGVVATGVTAYAVTGSVSSTAGATLAVGVVIGVAGALARLDRGPASALSPGRRGLIGSVATALVIGAAGYRLGEPAGETAVAGPDPVASAGGDGGGPGPEDLLAMAEQRSFDIDGIEPLISEDFYTVDISQVDPEPSSENWTLSVTGAVEEELEYDYQDLLDMNVQHHFVTLRCVGEKLNGHKMDTALWTGVPIADLVDPATLRGDYVMLRAADGFYEEFPVEALRTGLLAFGMNGQTLPRGHGHPARALIPGHWGEINVKWITEIEILAEPATGYWEERGWHGTGPVNTVAKLHAVNHRSDGRIEVGGHAYAGTRGIERVEVSTDGGTTWAEATLSDPLPGDDVWRQWVYRYEATETHDVVVRAVDGTGTRQPQDRSGAYPSGPTGWVSREVQP